MGDGRVTVISHILAGLRSPVFITCETVTHKTQKFKTEASKISFPSFSLRRKRLGSLMIISPSNILYDCLLVILKHEFMGFLRKKTVGFLDFETWEENPFNNPNDFMRCNVTFLYFMHWWCVWDGRSFKHHIVLFFRWWVWGQKVVKLVLDHRDQCEPGWEHVSQPLAQDSSTILQGLSMAVEQIHLTLAEESFLRAYFLNSFFFFFFFWNISLLEWGWYLV